MNEAAFRTRIRGRPVSEDNETTATRREEFRNAAPEAASLLDDPQVGPLLTGLFSHSPFLARLCVREAGFLAMFPDHPPETSVAALIAEATRAGDEATGLDDLMRRLRIVRRRLALAVGLCDLADCWEVEAVTGALSDFARESSRACLRFLLRDLHDRGRLKLADRDDPERDCGLFILAMGKLGARELNYSSDIDLIFLFDPDRTPHSGDGTQQDFIRLSQRFVKAMQEPTADGFVFRVDLRLRPDPGATPPVVSTVMAERYYETMGQNWERAAMIKARVLAGDREAGEHFLADMVPFIWRRSLDFAAIEDVHSIKRQIHSHKGHGDVAIEGHDIKLGRGGIRDIEFFVQTQQLIAGGREPALRTAGTCETLQALAALGWIAADTAKEMAAAYRAHRRLEHRIQMVADEQTHRLPEPPEAVDAMARFCGSEDTTEFRKTLRERLLLVQRHYQSLFEKSEPLGAEGNLVFTGSDADPETLQTLASMGYAQPAAVDAAVRGWHHGRYRATRTARAREILTRMMRPLLQTLAETPQPDAAFTRFDRFLGGLPAGIQLFSMLEAHPELLDLLARIVGAAPRLADYLGRNAGVLDAVLGGHFFEPLPEREALTSGLAQGLRLARDYQDGLDAARRFVKEHRFQIGVRLLPGGVDTDESGRDYSLLAETAVESLYAMVSEEFAERERRGRIAEGGQVLLAMGKLGSREMSETSDLDLIFVYDFPDGRGESDGARPLIGGHYYARLAQRMINAVSAPTGEGVLYEIDARLRPAGSNGPIASRFEAFVNYQHNDAWLWEHMALTRARVIAGDPALGERLTAQIREILSRPRDAGEVREAARNMRQRIFDAHGSRDPWQLKHVRGGLVDIEFIAQALQLIHARAHPEILATGTCEAFERLKQADLLEAGDADSLIAASRCFRAAIALTSVALDGPFDPQSSPRPLRAALCRAIGIDEDGDPEPRLRALQGDVLARFERLLG